jgi:hypothetical protein
MNEVAIRDLGSFTKPRIATTSKKKEKMMNGNGT